MTNGMSQHQVMMDAMFGTAGQQGDPNVNVPFMYRATQTPPSITGVSEMDALMAMAAPIIGTTMFGMVAPKMVPHLTGGMTPHQGLYARDVTQPMMEAGRQQMLYDRGQDLGNFGAKLMGDLGVPAMLGMSQRDFSRELSNLGGSAMGRVMTQQILQTDVMRGVMGGDVVRASDTLLGGRHKLGAIPGMLIDPMDIEGQAALMQHASAVSTEMMNSVYGFGDGSGRRSITPNQNYTRGYQVDDLAAMGTYMADRGVRGMQGIDIDPEEKARGIGEMARVMESLGELVGSDDMGTLMKSLEVLSNKQWPTIMSGGGGEGLIQSFRDMSAMADTLGVTGAVMADTVVNMQGTLKASMGITAGMSALGVSGGGYAGAGSQFMAERALAITSINPDKGHEQVVAEQGALINMAMNSEKGRAAQLINYLDQQGMVKGDMMEQWAGSIDQGDSQKQRSVSDMIYQQAYGSAALGRAIAGDSAIMDQVTNDTRDEFSVNALSQMLSMASSEYGEGVAAQGFRSMKRGTQTYGRHTGTYISLSADQMAASDIGAVTSYFNETGKETVAGDMKQIYDAAISSGKTTTQAMNDVNGILSGVDFDADRGSIRKRIDNGRTQAAADIVGLGTYDEVGKVNTLISSLRASSGLTYDQTSTYQGQVSAAKALADAGDIEGANKMAAEIQASIETTVGEDSLQYKYAMKNVKTASDRANVGKQATEAANTFTNRQLVGTSSGLGSGAINREQNALADIYSQVESGDMSDAEAFVQISDLDILQGSDYDAVVTKVGLGITPADVIQQRRIAMLSKDAMMREVNATGLKGLDDATEDVNGSQGVYADAKEISMANAEMNRDIDDDRQDLKATTPQLLGEALQGFAPFSRLFGVEETDPAALASGGKKRSWWKNFSMGEVKYKDTAGRPGVASMHKDAEYEEMKSVGKGGERGVGEDARPKEFVMRGELTLKGTGGTTLGLADGSVKAIGGR